MLCFPYKNVTNTIFYVFRLQKCVFSKRKKSAIFLKMRSKNLLIQIFHRLKISQKIKMKQKRELSKNALKFNAIFMFFDTK